MVLIIGTTKKAPLTFEPPQIMTAKPILVAKALGAEKLYKPTLALK